MLHDLRAKLNIFATSFLQVMFVSMNVVFISKDFLFCLLTTGFLISFIWTYNVKRVVFGDIYTRLIYSTGASIGTGAGYFLAKYLITII
jgi:hypothetical protein